MTLTGLFVRSSRRCPVKYVPVQGTGVFADRSADQVSRVLSVERVRNRTPPPLFYKSTNVYTELGTAFTLVLLYNTASVKSEHLQQVAREYTVSGHSSSGIDISVLRRRGRSEGRRHPISAI